MYLFQEILSWIKHRLDLTLISHKKYRNQVLWGTVNHKLLPVTQVKQI
jgi:hypothetical protein